jgi:hypothetical protein
MEADKSSQPLEVGSSEGLGPVVPKRDRATSNPGGCECEHCGCIFIGGPEHSICGDCFAAYKEAMRQDEQRAEWHAEMRRDAFGA